MHRRSTVRRCLCLYEYVNLGNAGQETSSGIALGIAFTQVRTATATSKTRVRCAECHAPSGRCMKQEQTRTATSAGRYLYILLSTCCDGPCSQSASRCWLLGCSLLREPLATTASPRLSGVACCLTLLRFGRQREGNGSRLAFPARKRYNAVISSTHFHPLQVVWHAILYIGQCHISPSQLETGRHEWQQTKTMCHNCRK